jgi:hypothetical protein
MSSSFLELRRRHRRPAAFGRGLLGLLTAAILLPASVPASLPATAGSEAWPSRVRALYRISFGGIDIGTFNFDTGIGPQGYTADGKAELSALLGAFQWQGITRVSGTVDGTAPHPAGYTFAFRSTSRTGTVKMGFQRDSITNVSMVPQPEDLDEIVPVKPQHLQNVLDPLSAVLALARPTGTDPCGRKLAIFDGKQRFDLVMSFRREVRIAEARPSGQPSLGLVCGVRYVPIAGYKKDHDGTSQLSRERGIEVVLRPVPSANLYIPHEITVPTAIGSAVLTAHRIEIEQPGSGQIALTE